MQYTALHHAHMFVNARAALMRVHTCNPMRAYDGFAHVLSIFVEPGLCCNDPVRKICGDVAWNDTQQ